MELTHRIYEIFGIFNQHNPNPKTELIYTNEFELIVAVVLSAQATDIMVNNVTKNLFAIASTPQDMINLGADAIMQHIKQLGLYRNKARNVYNLADMLLKCYNSCVPDTFEELIKLPGVGEKTANVVLNVLFNQPLIAVDTHVFRVSRRLGLSEGKTPSAVTKDLERIIPDEFKMIAHHHLVLHGRYVCKAQKPMCNKCVISQYCSYNS